jgi:predicted HicB family RNase H-like nuclease
MKLSDQYLKIVEWSDEDGCYVGRCPGLMLGGIHGSDETKVYKELCQAVEEWVEIFEEDEEPLPVPTAMREYSGKLVVRLGKELHEELAIEALQNGESLNSYCVKMLRGRLKGRIRNTYKTRRASRNRPSKAASSKGKMGKRNKGLR